MRASRPHVCCLLCVACARVQHKIGGAQGVMEFLETASKELKIERKMEAIEKVWNSLDLDYVPHKDSDVFGALRFKLERQLKLEQV